MRTKKTNKTLIQTHVAGSESPFLPNPSPANSSEADLQKPDRISFNVTDSGAPDWNRMLPKTKEQLTKLLQNKAVQKELGITEETAREIEKLGFGQDEADSLLSLISGINSTGASIVYRIPSEITSKAFEFTPDHRKKISPPMIRVMNKWAPMILKTWKDEIGLGMIMFSVINAQIRLMHLLEDQRKRVEGKTPVREKVTPIAPPKKVEPETPAEAPASPPAAEATPPDLLDVVGFEL